MSRMTFLSFVFPSTSMKTSLKINSEMTWLSFLFHYKRLNLYFTIKLFFEIRISHYIHAIAFSCKTPNLASDPAHGCTSLFTAHWGRLAIWSNMNKYTHCEGSHLNINVPVFILMKFHNRLGICDENSTIARRFSWHQSRCFRLCANPKFHCDVM